MEKKYSRLSLALLSLSLACCRLLCLVHSAIIHGSRCEYPVPMTTLLNTRQCITATLAWFGVSSHDPPTG